MLEPLQLMSWQLTEEVKDGFLKNASSDNDTRISELPLFAFLSTTHIAKNSSKHMKKKSLYFKSFIENIQDFLLILGTVKEIQCFIGVRSLPDYKQLRGGSTCWKVPWEKNSHFSDSKRKPPHLWSLPWGVAASGGITASHSRLFLASTAAASPSSSGSRIGCSTQLQSSSLCFKIALEFSSLPLPFPHTVFLHLWCPNLEGKYKDRHL